MGAVMVASACVATAAMVVLWVASVRLRDASIVDVFWGPGFAAIAWTSVLVAGPSARGILLASLATAWGMRLGVYLAWRRRGQGEDRRYRAMREARGESFAMVSLFTVFLFQAALMWAVSLPLQAGAAFGRAAPLRTTDVAGIALFLVGLAFEAIGDAQLARYLSTASGRGGVMQEGLWRYTRHPNYFGDFLVWWGIGLLSVPTGQWWALAGPSIMSVLLMRVSGVTLLERTISERRPEYASYAARTSAFFPRPPRRHGSPVTPPPSRRA